MGNTVQSNEMEINDQNMEIQRINEEMGFAEQQRRESKSNCDVLTDKVLGLEDENYTLKTSQIDLIGKLTIFEE